MLGGGVGSTSARAFSLTGAAGWTELLLTIGSRVAFLSSGPIATSRS
jgi:hypothetical protein